MTRGLDEKKFEANVPAALADAMESWMQGRDVSNRGMAKAMIRLFLGAPEWLQMMAYFGKPDAITINREAIRAILQLAEEQSEGLGPREFAARVVRGTEARAVRPRGKKAAGG